MGKAKINIPLGTKYGSLQAIGPETKRGRHRAMVCKCECGAVIIVSCSNLHLGLTVSCGCSRTSEKYKNLVGKKFGRLTITDETLVFRGKKRVVQCLCDCGNHYEAYLHFMAAGRVKSCGCLLREVTTARTLKHGHTAKSKRSSEYGSWAAMIKRCESPGATGFARYGGRGIRVCAEWHVFENFLSDMGKKPSPEYSIERDRVNDDYSPDNCKWATDREQANNRRNTAMFIYLGRSQSLADWARELNHPYSRLRTRIFKLGWTVERAFNTPGLTA